jgi:hypothetical protein
MSTRKNSLLLALVLLAAMPLYADLHSVITATYDFRPRDLDQSSMNAKSAALDAFWERVKTAGAPTLDELRKELQRPDVPSFFSYDGSKLLLSLSDTPADEKIAAAAIARADIADLQMDDYFFTVHALAIQGQDTTAAAFNILRAANFQVIVPQHALTLNPLSCLMYTLLPLPETVYVPALVQRLDAEKDAATQILLLNVLVYAVDNDADHAIRKFAKDPAKPAEARTIAQGMVKVIVGAKPRASTKKVEQLRRERRESLSIISDEAIDEIQRLTKEMRLNQT